MAFKLSETRTKEREGAKLKSGWWKIIKFLKIEGIFILRWAKNVDGRRGSRKSSKKILEKWRMIGGRKEGGCDILRGGRPRHRASKSLLPLETSLALNQLLIQPSCDAKFFPAPDKVRAENRSSHPFAIKLSWIYLFGSSRDFFVFHYILVISWSIEFFV